VAGVARLSRHRLAPPEFSSDGSQIGALISHPDFFSFFVAACAGAGEHAVAVDREVRCADRRAHLRHDDPGPPNIGVAAAYTDWKTWLGSIAQLAVNHQPGFRSS
jgi:hypothetical protein